MKRLTQIADFGLEEWEQTFFKVKSDPNGAYNIVDIAMCYYEPEFNTILRDISLRLAAYEDTGLDPEDIITGKEMAEIACAMNLLKEYQEIGTPDRLRELAQADKEGRCVVLPCKLGDTTFVVANNAIKEMEVKYIQSATDGSICMQAECKDETECCYCNGPCGVRFTPENMQQRNVHLTREEAETALRREQDG